jgi:hypothetical protein
MVLVMRTKGPGGGCPTVRWGGARGSDKGAANDELQESKGTLDLSYVICTPYARWIRVSGQAKSPDQADVTGPISTNDWLYGCLR